MHMDDLQSNDLKIEIFNQCERPFTSGKKTASKNTGLRTHLDDLGLKKINVVMNIYFIFEEESLLICQI